MSDRPVLLGDVLDVCNALSTNWSLRTHVEGGSRRGTQYRVRCRHCQRFDTYTAPFDGDEMARTAAMAKLTHTAACPVSVARFIRRSLSETDAMATVQLGPKANAWNVPPVPDTPVQPHARRMTDE